MAGIETQAGGPEGDAHEALQVAVAEQGAVELHQFEPGHAAVEGPMTEPFGGAIGGQGLHGGGQAGGGDFG